MLVLFLFLAVCKVCIFLSLSPRSSLSGDSIVGKHEEYDKFDDYRQGCR